MEEVQLEAVASYRHFGPWTFSLEDKMFVDRRHSVSWELHLLFKDLPTESRSREGHHLQWRLQEEPAGRARLFSVPGLINWTVQVDFQWSVFDSSLSFQSDKHERGYRVKPTRLEKIFEGREGLFWVMGIRFLSAKCWAEFKHKSLLENPQTRSLSLCGSHWPTRSAVHQRFMSTSLFQSSCISSIERPDWIRWLESKLKQQFHDV